MLTNLFIGVMMAIGTGGWVYSKLQRYTGGNSQSSLTGAAIVGLFAGIIIFTLLGLLF